MLALLVGCSGGAPRSLAATDPPGNAIVSFPNSPDKKFTTALLSNPDGLQAGIDGRVLTVAVFSGSAPFANEMTLDLNGNLGIRGIVASRSSRAEKKEIKKYDGDALKLLDRLQIVSYLYRNEKHSDPLHVGFIAEEAPVLFTGPQHTSFNLNNSLAINMAATQQLNAKVASLEHDVAVLQREIKFLRRR